MRELVVDASVALKWLFLEDGHDDAVRIAEQYHSGGIRLVAPYLLIAEVSNALWKRVRRRELTPEQARRGFAQLLFACPQLVHSESMSQSALDLAMAHGHPAYDCLYVACALECQCDLVTADGRLFQALGGAYPFVRLLRDFSAPEPRA